MAAFAIGAAALVAKAARDRSGRLRGRTTGELDRGQERRGPLRSESAGRVVENPGGSEGYLRHGLRSIQEDRVDETEGQR